MIKDTEATEVSYDILAYLVQEATGKAVDVLLDTWRQVGISTCYRYRMTYWLTCNHRTTIVCEMTQVHDMHVYE